MEGETAVRSDLDGRAARIRIERPEHANAFTLEMIAALARQIEAVSQTSDVLLIEGGADFSVGRERGSRTGSRLSDTLETIARANSALTAYTGPVICAVRGQARGFGCGLAIQADLVIAGDSATLAFNEIEHGSPPLTVMSYLDRYVHHHALLDLILTGRVVSAEEALRMGLLSRIVADDQVETQASLLVEKLKTLDASALRRAKSYAREIRLVPDSLRPRYAVASQVEFVENAR